MDSENKHGAGSLQVTENSVIADASDLFSPILLESSLVDGSTTMYRPLNLSNEGPIEFNIKPMGMKYIHPSATRLFAQLKITNADGGDIAADATAAFANLPLSSIFKQIEIDVGGFSAPELGNNFSHYKAYFETVLTYSQSARDSHLRASILKMDVAQRFEDYTVNGGGHNTGYQQRRLLTAQSISMQICTPVHCDFLQLNKYIPPGVEITIRFHRSPDAFAIVAHNNNNQFKVVIEDIKLYVRHVTLSDDIVKQHIKLFEKGPAIFSLNKTILKTIAHPAGLTHVTVPNLFTGLLPKSIIIALVSAASFNGTYATNPYYFRHYSCNYSVLNVNGDNIPSDPYRPNFAQTLFAREYRDFFDNVGISHDDLGNVMTPELYAGGMFMIAFDLSPDRCNGYHAHKQKTGVINLELGFPAAIDHPWNVLAFATYDSSFLLDGNNRVMIEGMSST